EQGLQKDIEFGPSDRQLWEPLEVTKGYEVVELDGRSDVILISEKGMRRINGITGKDVWPGGERSMEKKDQPAVANRTDYFWNGGWDAFSDYQHLITAPPWLVRPAPALGASKTRSLVWASQKYPWLLAVSTQTGTVQWMFLSKKGRFNDGALCPPIVVNARQKGEVDLVTLFGPGKNQNGGCWGGAISRGQGESLWHYPIESASAAMALRRLGGRDILVIADRARLVGLDVRTGKEVWPPRNLGIVPLGKPIFADLDGRDNLSLILVEYNGRQEYKEYFTVKAMSLAGKLLWEHRVESRAPFRNSL